ncbi:MAG: pimeloyl-ACP methyl ester carboxylesterase [Myxococcota bacterium]|jgi:pimeloyl-ACP methyl ester carboxylesterase
MIADILDRAANRVGTWTLHRRGLGSIFLPTRHGLIHGFDGVGTGSGPPVVMLHGISAGAVPFGRVMVRLMKHHRHVLALDALGHGLSVVPPKMSSTILLEGLEDALDAAALDRPVLFGNSMGGGMALWYASEFPERVSGVMLTSPAGADAGTLAMTELASGLRMDSLAQARHFVTRIFHDEPWFGRALAPFVRARFQRSTVRALLDDAPSAPRMTSERLAQLTMPLLVLWGMSDTVLPDVHRAYYRDHLPPHAIFEEWPDVGHCPHLEAPARLARRIVEFVGKGS